MADDMQVQVTRHYAVHRGDHAAEAISAHAYDPDETVADLVKRVLGLPTPRWSGPPSPADFITLRLVVGTEPQVGEVSDAVPF